MGAEEKRKYERVDTTVKVKLSGDADWTECTTSNVSAGGLFFESARSLNIGDTVSMQFMLQSKAGTLGNVHFFVSAKVVRIIPYCGAFQIAVEFIIEDDVRKEILKLIELIKGQNLKVERPTTLDAVFHKKKPEEQS
ncbi:MAG TPA: PilZ domain-containing protein [Dissulfurispiraceae bacterium]|nr:PilZ domain-containing protein [Dissulfurispiraceae bacterium]